VVREVSKVAAAALSLLVECCVSNQKIAKPWFDSQSNSALLCSWERHFMPLSHLGAKHSTCHSGPEGQKICKQKRSVLKWYDR